MLLLCGDHAVSDLKDTQVMVEIMSEVLKLFLDKQWKEIPVETADLLPQLEGKQETYFEQWLAGEEIPMDELAKSNLPECKVLDVYKRQNRFRMMKSICGRAFLQLWKRQQRNLLHPERWKVLI